MAENLPDEIPLPDEVPLSPAVAPERAKPGVGEALARGAAQGATLGFADELAGMARAGVKVPGDVRAPGPKALAKLYPGVPYPEAAAKWFDANRPDVQAAESAESVRQGQQAAYESERDKEREANRAAREAHPVAFGAGELGTAAATAPLLPIAAPAKGASLLTRVAQGAKSAAPVGAAFGLGASEKKDVGGQMLDTFTGAGTAAALGGALPVVAEGVSKVADPIAEWLRNQSIKYGRKALTGNAGTLASIRPPSEEAVQAALDAGAIRPFRNVQGIAEKLGVSVDEVEAKLGNVLQQLEAAGVKGPSPAAVEQILKTRGLDAFKDSGLEKVRRIYAEAANSLNDIGQIQPGNLGLTQAEKIKRAHQREANYTRAQQDTNAMGAQKEVASILRQANEDAVASQAAKAPDLASQFVPLKQELGPLLEAQNFADIAAARAARHKGLSLTDTIAGAAGLQHAGAPGAVAMAVANKLGRTRGPATLSWLTSKGANAADALAGGASSPSATPFTPNVVEWVRGRMAGEPLPVGLHPATAGDEAAAGGGTVAPAPVQGEQQQGNKEAPAHGPDLVPSTAGPQGSAAPAPKEEEPPKHVHVVDKLSEVLARDPAALGAFAAPLALRMRVGGREAVAKYDYLMNQRDPKYREAMAKAIGDERMETT